ncbi:hypothetical protein NM688_g2367 [Phlebia brevispora]|uniref:Uncharacterized protein n=1 Tax=Phlebia brevispora TaxID=194682 RepID=A0ACC1T962_9APHY|nr:hypothetical protein NM688_g2367 [Phlebia brevispora]
MSTFRMVKSQQVRCNPWSAHFEDVGVGSKFSVQIYQWASSNNRDAIRDRQGCNERFPAHLSFAQSTQSYFAEEILPMHVFVAERLSFLLLSFILDYSVYHLVPHGYMIALVLLGSSSTLLTFQLRPFSNSLEAALLALSLVAYQRLYRSPTKAVLTCFTALVVFGIFTRITFLAFALPIVVSTLLNLWHGSSRNRISFLQNLAYIAFAALTVATALVLVDSRFFYGSFQHLAFTPYNLLLYNLSSENLAKHGLHPRWLHVTVNLPMIVGPTLVAYGLKAGWKHLTLPSALNGRSAASPSRSINSICVYVIMISLVLLSVQPHQEPRFLTPLLVPFIVLVANHGIQNVGRWFWIITMALNFALALVFGVLHQGGVVRSLLNLHELINVGTTQNRSTIVYWKTYMPPRHLLAIPRHHEQKASVTDLAGSSPLEMQQALSSFTPEYTMLYLVTPPFAVQQLPSDIRSCFSTKSLVFPHLDLDHIPESVAMGWKDGLSLGIYTSSPGCLHSHPPSYH